MQHPLQWGVGTLQPIDLRLRYITCFGQWNVNVKCWAKALWVITLLFCPLFLLAHEQVPNSVCYFILYCRMRKWSEEENPSSQIIWILLSVDILMLLPKHRQEKPNQYTKITWQCSLLNTFANIGHDHFKAKYLLVLLLAIFLLLNLSSLVFFWFTFVTKSETVFFKLEYNLWNFILFYIFWFLWLMMLSLSLLLHGISSQSPFL